MPRNQKPKQHISVKLTQAQRQVVAEVAPGLADRLKLAERNQRAIRFTLAELEAIRQKAGAALRHAITGRKENALRHVLDAATHVIEHHRGAGPNPAPSAFTSSGSPCSARGPRSGGASR